MKRRLGVQGMKRRSEPLESERLYSAQISWLSSQAEQQARRADNAELRFMKSRQERAEAIKARDLALLRERTLRGRLDEVKSDFFSTQQSVIRLEKERDQRVVTDAQGNTYRLFEIQIAQPKPGEVNVDGRGKGKRVAVPFVVSQWAGSLKCREGNKIRIPFKILHVVVFSGCPHQNQLLGFCFPCQLYGYPVFVVLPGHSNK